jgi:hypothetical protein
MQHQLKKATQPGSRGKKLENIGFHFN